MNFEDRLLVGRRRRRRRRTRPILTGFKPYTYRSQNRILLSIHLIFIHSNDVVFDCVIRFSG